MARQTKVSLSGRWSVSFIELNNGKRQFKVTKAFTGLSLSETRFFDDGQEAEIQFTEWLL